MTSTRLVRAIRGIIREMMANLTFFGAYRYRVVDMAVNRVTLQAVDSELGLPDISPIAIHSGVAGAWAKLAPGAIVIVTFADGKETMPMVTAFEDKDGNGFLPLAVCIDASQKIAIGTSDPDDADAWPAARAGDIVQCLMPPSCLVKGFVGTPPAEQQFTGTITLVDPIMGIIYAGSPKVTIK